MSSNTILGPEWNLSPDGQNLITNNGVLKDPKQCLKLALDSDLKSIGKSALPNLTSSSKMVLQIAKIRNVAAPKANEQSQAAPRMLKLTLTDGDGYVQAIEIGPVTSLSREKTAPGTKCLVDGAKYIGGFLLVDNSNFKVLGGHVEHLYDKWQVAKSVKINHLIGSSGAAPPWVPFGHKLAPKLVENVSKDRRDVKDEASEFELQRKEAIMEVSSGAVKKTFGGRVRQNVVSVPQQQQQKFVRNAKKSFRTEDVEERPQRPLEKVSLFAFLEDKLPQTQARQEQKSASTTKLPQDWENYEHKRNGFVQTNNFSRNQGNVTTQQQNTNNFSRNLGNMATQQQNTNNFSRNQGNVATQQNNNYNQPHNVANNSSYQNRTPQQPNNNFSNRNQEQHNNYNQSRNVANNSASYQNHRTQPNNTHQDGYRKQSNNYSRSNDVGYQKPKSVAAEERSKYNNKNSQEQHHNMATQDGSRNNHNNVATTRDQHQLANNMSKLSINSEFASRTLRNHLNLPPSGAPSVTQVAPSMIQVAPSSVSSLNVGDQCMAKYWEDGKFYPASVAAVTDRTYAVNFQGYGNIEEVLRQDCFVTPGTNQQQKSFQGNSLEFRSRRKN